MNTKQKAQANINKFIDPYRRINIEQIKLAVNYGRLKATL